MKLYRAFATVGGLTMVSRVLGFARDILIAATLGSGAVADAFFVAFRFPNLFRRLFGEGAFNSAFVPLFAKRLEGEGREAARKFAEEALAGLVFVLLLLTAVAEIAMPFLMLRAGAGLQRDAGEVRPRGAADAHHHALPAVHVGGGAAVGRAELARQVRRELGGLHRAQPHHDGGDAHRHGDGLAATSRWPASCRRGACSPPASCSSRCCSTVRAATACGCGCAGRA